jgi:hypothetical protein
MIFRKGRERGGKKKGSKFKREREGRNRWMKA